MWNPSLGPRGAYALVTGVYFAAIRQKELQTLAGVYGRNVPHGKSDQILGMWYKNDQYLQI